MLTGHDRVDFVDLISNVFFDIIRDRLFSNGDSCGDDGFVEI